MHVRGHRKSADDCSKSAYGGKPGKPSPGDGGRKLGSLNDTIVDREPRSPSTLFYARATPVASKEGV